MIFFYIEIKGGKEKDENLEEVKKRFELSRQGKFML
jgi:hypothetical protein